MKQLSHPENIELPSSGQRGPAEHDRRLQILKVANEHFRHHGYRKTTVADLSKAIGITTAYIYRFFDSKQAIGEAICAMVLGNLDTELRRLSDLESTPTRKLRAFIKHALALSHGFFMGESKLYELVRVSEEEGWCTAAGHQEALSEMIRSIIVEGRNAGEFERKTPLDEVVLGIQETLIPYTRPSAMDRRAFPDLEAGMLATTGMILRSLAP